MKETQYPEFWNAFLAGIPLGVLFAGFVFAIIGVLLNGLLKAATRNPEKVGTPVQWSWKTFWSQNLKRFLTSAAITLLVIFVSLRFFKEITGSGTELSMFYSFGIGFGIDKAIIALKKKTGKDE